MRQRITARIAACGAAFFAALSLLTGCGEQKTAETPTWPSDITITLNSGDGSDDYTLAAGEMIYGTAGATYVENAAGDKTETLDKTLSVHGVAVGDELDVLFSAGLVKAGYASLISELPGEEDGKTEIEKKTYEGETLDLLSMNAYDCMILVSYYYEDGKWQLLDLTKDSPEMHEHVIAITYDIQGPMGSYGVKTGQVCGIFCEFY